MNLSTILLILTISQIHSFFVDSITGKSSGDQRARQLYSTSNPDMTSSINSKMDLSNLSVGFLGCGKISSAVCNGLATAESPYRPKKIFVSRRNAEKSASLKEKYPDIVDICENAEVVAASDIIFIGLLPPAAREELPGLPFIDDQFVVSMMAAVNYADVVDACRISASRIVRTVPLPSSARRQGPILCFPANSQIESILRILGTPVVCDSEEQMKPLVAITGQISPFYEIMKVTQDFTSKNGVPEDISRLFISSFYSSLAATAEQSHDSFQELCHEAATPGGINEQAMKKFNSEDHYSKVTQSLEEILSRLRK